MKIFLFVITALTFLQGCKSGSPIFELAPASNMSITGKGPGQDAAYNPYFGRKCIAVVNNLGKNKFNVRVQSNGSIVETRTIEPRGKAEILLLENYELYLDSQFESTARVVFKKTK